MFKTLFWITFTAVSILAVIPLNETMPESMQISDKLNHIVAFLTLYLLHTVAFSRLSISRHIFYLFAYGILIEFVQYFLPHRSTSVYDLFADMIGIAFAVVIHQIFIHFRQVTV